MASRSVKPFLHRWIQSLPILYNGMPLLPSKLLLPTGGSGPPCNRWFPDPTRVLHSNGILISAAVFAGLTSVTDRPTDHATRSVTIGLHLHCVSKNAPLLTCYNLDIHGLITTIYGTRVTKKVGNQNVLHTMSQKTSHLWLAITLMHMNGFWYFLAEMLPIK